MIQKIKSYDEQIVDKLNEIIDWINNHEIEEPIQREHTFTDPYPIKKGNLYIDDSGRRNSQPTCDSKSTDKAETDPSEVGKSLRVVYDRLMNEKKEGKE